MLKNKTAYFAAGAMAFVGLVAGFATMAGAQSIVTGASATSAPATTVAPTTTQAVDAPDAPGTTETQHHAPLGGDGVVSSISGTTITIGEEADEGGASYTVDASKATFTNNGAAATIADIKVGEKVFVQGTTSGTNVTATSVSVGHKGGHVESAAEAANEPAGQ